jgi:hypothetical protein
MFGLLNKSNLSVLFDIENYRIIEVNGFDLSDVEVEVSENKVFTIPSHILVDQEPLYPSKYEILNTGTILYSSSKVPSLSIQIEDNNFLNYRAKEKKYTVTPKELKLLIQSKRKRTPSQNQIMGESASTHANQLIQNGVLKLKGQVQVSWHWCHLIAFSLLPTKSAQTKRNLVCGTSACNGQMLNIETAVKRFVIEYNRPLGLEVRAEYYYNSHVARRIRYRIYDKKGSKMSHSEYFDALNNVKADISDYISIYNRMLATFN